jgi:hypothetical protein
MDSAAQKKVALPVDGSRPGIGDIEHPRLRKGLKGFYHGTSNESGWRIETCLM